MMKGTFKLTGLFSLFRDVFVTEEKPPAEKVTIDSSVCTPDQITLDIDIPCAQLVCFSLTNVFPGLVVSQSEEGYYYLFPENLQIDWGDGIVSSDCSHHFERAGAYRITIGADRLYYLDCSANQCITRIDLSKSPYLEYLDRRGNPLQEIVGQSTFVRSYPCDNKDPYDCATLQVADVELDSPDSKHSIGILCLQIKKNRL